MPDGDLVSRPSPRPSVSPRVGRMPYTGAMRFLTLALAAVALAVTVACGGGDSSGTTPQPSAATPAPVRTAAPTPAPATDGLTSEAIVEGMIRRGLPVGEYANFSATIDPEGLLGKPHQYTSRSTFADVRILPMTQEYPTVADGGAVEVFDNEADAQARLAAITAANPEQPAYLEGTAILRLSEKLTPEQAAEYEAGFRAVVRGE